MLDYAGEEVTADQGEGSRVERNETPVGQDHAPSAYECVPFADGFLCIYELTSAEWVFPDEITVAERYDNDEKGAYEHSGHGAQRSCFWQERASGQDEASPAYDRA